MKTLKNCAFFKWCDLNFNFFLQFFFKIRLTLPFLWSFMKLFVAQTSITPLETFCALTIFTVNLLFNQSYQWELDFCQRTNGRFILTDLKYFIMKTFHWYEGKFYSLNAKILEKPLKKCFSEWTSWTGHNKSQYFFKMYSFR